MIIQDERKTSQKGIGMIDTAQVQKRYKMINIISAQRGMGVETAESSENADIPNGKLITKEQRMANAERFTKRGFFAISGERFLINTTNKGIAL